MAKVNLKEGRKEKVDYGRKTFGEVSKQTLVKLERLGTRHRTYFFPTIFVSKNVIFQQHEKPYFLMYIFLNCIEMFFFIMWAHNNKHYMRW